MTRSTPKVSVILTSYNHAKYLREAIDSALAQTFTDFELIIWDDASSDNSWEIIQSYQDPRIKAFRNTQRRRGVYGINNAISEVAVGEYIAIHHSDDVWELEKLEEQVAFLDANRSFGAVFSVPSFIDEDGKFICRDHIYTNVFASENKTRHRWLREFFERGNCLCHPSVVIRKACFDKCGLYRYGLGQLCDYDMWIRLTLVYEIFITPKKLLRFRIRDNNLNSSGISNSSKSRLAYEHFLTLDNYSKISSESDLVDIFPEAKKFCAGDNPNLKYALAMTCLELNVNKNSVTFGLNNLFEIVNDSSLKNDVLIDPYKFIELTGGLDPLEALEIDRLQKQEKLLSAELNEQIAQRDGQIAQRDGQIFELSQKLDLLFSSRSWRYTKPLRSIFSTVKKIVSVLKNVKSVANKCGGYGPLIKKGLLYVKRNGFKRALINFKLRLFCDSSSFFNGLVILQENDYENWLKLYDTLDGSRVNKIREEIEGFNCKPKISVVMPVYNAPLKFLVEAIDSVVNQIYDNWELCIADDASTNKDIRPLLESYSKKDERIKVVFRQENDHISAASNSALELATGDFVALLDNDDLLPIHALYCVAKAIIKNPDVALLYSDEDKINEDGFRYDPYFKCDLNYELLLAQNMISHLGVYRRDLLEKICGFRLGFEGAQDYDLVLRVLEQVQLYQVVHIPQVLYHWRAIPGSTALSSGEKNYAAEAGRKAVEEHLQRTGRGGMVAPAPEVPAMNRVRYPVPTLLPLVSIIIPTRDRADILSVCLESLLTKTSYDNYEIIVVDNGSVEAETFRLLDAQPKAKITVIRDDAPFNFSRLNNLAADHAKGELICLMNNDIEILTNDWLEEMLSFAYQRDIGCVGARLWYPDGRLQHGGVVLGIGGVAGHAHKYLPKGNYGYFSRAVLHQSFSAVTAACLLIRRSVWDEVNGLDESLAVAFNDVDFCLRVREKGYRNVWTPYAEMIHHESVSRGSEDNPEKIARFHREIRLMEERWGEKLGNDPAYSPNLTLYHENFSLNWH